MKPKKLISWCLYVDPDNLRRLPEYLLGLKSNQRAARMHFSDWQLRLYVDHTLEKYPALHEYVTDIARYGWPEIEIVKCRTGANPMVERFRALLDDSVDVVLIRDIDSILSRTDADMVNEWLANEHDIDVFRYREYQMKCNWSMGGGMGGRTRAFVGHLDDSPVVNKKGRNHDESVLARMLSHIPEERQRCIVTRMTCEGTYMIWQGRAAKPTDCAVLWPVPFFDCNRGWGDEIKEIKEAGDDVTKLVQWCQNASIRREYIGAHYEHHRDTIVRKTEGWVR